MNKPRLIYQNFLIFKPRFCLQKLKLQRVPTISAHHAMCAHNFLCEEFGKVNETIETLETSSRGVLGNIWTLKVSIIL